MFEIRKESFLNSCFTFKFFKTCFICDRNIYFSQTSLTCSHSFHKHCIQNSTPVNQCPICYSKAYIETKKRSSGNSHVLYYSSR